MSGRKSKTHPLRHGYERLLLSCWLIAMLSLAFPWWKSINAYGAIGIGSPIFLVGTGIIGGSAFVEGGPDRSGWSRWGHYGTFEGYPRSEDLDKLGAYGYFGNFFWGADHLLMAGSTVAVILPIWFLMLAISLLFLALHLFLKRRIRLILGKLPDPSRLMGAAESK